MWRQWVRTGWKKTVAMLSNLATLAEKAIGEGCNGRIEIEMTITSDHSGGVARRALWNGCVVLAARHCKIGLNIPRTLLSTVDVTIVRGDVNWQVRAPAFPGGLLRVVTNCSIKAHLHVHTVPLIAARRWPSQFACG